MYHEYHILSLSKNQLRNLAKGKPVRMRKHHAGNRVHLTKEQIEHLEHAHSKGKSHMISFTDQQIRHHMGKGFFDSIKRVVRQNKNILNPIIKATKTAGHRAVHKLTSHLHHKIEEIPEISGEGLVKHKRRGRPRKHGTGIISDVLGGLSKGANLFGFGVGHHKKHHHHTKHHGEGFVSDLVKTGAKKILPAVVDAVAGAAKNKIAGMGLRKHKTTTHRKKTTHKRHMKGSALLPAGYGGSLFPA